MTWNQIAYGTLVAAGMTTVGVLVWFESRTQVKVVDILEVFQGTWERCAVTRVTTNVWTRWPATVIITNTSFVYGSNDPSGKAWYDWSAATNRLTNYYRTVTATNVVVTTNSFVKGRFKVTPPRVDFNYVEPLTNKYIWGGYTQYVVTGMTGTSASNNGTYQWASRSVTNNKVTDRYVNASGTNATVLYDYGYRGKFGVARSAEFNDGSYAFASTAKGKCIRFGPWSGTGVSGIRVAASGLNDALMSDAWCETNKTYYNGLDWATDARMIDVDAMNEENPAPSLGTLGPDKIRSCIMTIPVAYSAHPTNYPYVDDSQADSNGAFVGFTMLPVNTFSQFWARTGIGWLYPTNYDGTNRQWLMFHDENPTNAGWDYIEHSNWLLSASNLQERYEALYYLKWTHWQFTWSSFGDTYASAWIAGQASNTYAWTGASTSSWGAAKIACAAATPTITTVNGAPYGYTRGTWNGSTWTAYAYARQSRMKLEGVWTGLTCVVDSYAYPEKPGYAYAIFDAGGTGLLSNQLCRFSVVTNAAGNRSSVTSAPLGSVSFPSGVWCDQPSNNSAKGWIVSSDWWERDAVLKPNFNYCTNAIP